MSGIVPDMALVIAVLVVLICLWLCSLVEAALFSVPMIKVRQLAESQKTSAVALLKIREDMKDPIAALVILINISTIVGSIVVGGIAATVLGDKWMGVFSGVLTFLVIIFAEIIPKTLGERNAISIGLFCARPIRLITAILRPVIWILQKITEPVTKGGSTQLTTSEAELKLLASIGRETGVIDSTESDLIQRSFKLDNLTARDIMTPRVTMTYLQGDRTVADAKPDIAASQHTRIVITGKNRDDVLGICRKDQLLLTLVEGQGKTTLRELAQKTPRFAEGVSASELFDHFRKTRLPFGIVEDEFGGISGVVTLEDVLEILTGEIIDETDRDVDLRQKAKEAAQA